MNEIIICPKKCWSLATDTEKGIGPYKFKSLESERTLSSNMKHHYRYRNNVLNAEEHH